MNRYMIQKLATTRGEKMSTQGSIQANEVLQAATRYADLGFKVIPLHGINANGCTCSKGKDCDKPGKHPRIVDWTNQATADKEKLTEWFTRWSNSNIGLATGATNGIIAIDIDPRHGGDYSIADLQNEYGKLPDTVEQLTGGGGQHLLFKYPGYTIQNKVSIAPGVDIRGDGGQIVVSPSIHESGNRYEWEASSILGEVEIAELPKQWIDFIKAGAVKKTDNVINSEAAKLHVSRGITDGSRNGTLFKLCCSLRTQGYEKDEILQLIRQVNLNRCKPPLEDSEIEEMVDNLCKRYEPGVIIIEKNNIKHVDSRQEKNCPELTTIDGITLYEKDLPPIRFIIESMIAPGLHLLAGPRKEGKSWLVLWLCLQIAMGRNVWRWSTKQGTALYLCLEDNISRIQGRFKAILNGNKPPPNIHFALMSKTVKNGLIEQLDMWMEQHPDTCFIVIDTLQKVRKASSTNNVYAEDYEDVGSIKEVADKHGIAILLVHHLRKLLDTDIFNMISGSTGITGCVDGIFVLKKEDRKSQEGTLYGTGRDIEDMEILLSFNKQKHIWEFVSCNAEEYKEDIRFFNNPLLILLKRFINEDNPSWTGKASELFARLLGLVEDYDNTNDLPQSPSALGKEVRNLSFRLAKEGIYVGENRSGNKRTLSLFYKLPSLPSLPSQSLDTEGFEQFNLDDCLPSPPVTAVTHDIEVTASDSKENMPSPLEAAINKDYDSSDSNDTSNKSNEKPDIDYSVLCKKGGEIII